MSRIFTDDERAWLSRPHVARAWFGAFDLPSGMIRLHNGTGRVTVGGFEWRGVSDPVGGRMVSIGPVEEPQFGQAASVEIVLSGVSADFIQSVHTDARAIEGRAADIYFSVFDGESQEVWPFGLKKVFPKGRMSSPALHRSGIGRRTISLTVESVFATQNFPPGGRWNSADQKRRYPGDKGLDFVGVEISEQWI